jgi:hypothetical protein
MNNKRSYLVHGITLVEVMTAILVLTIVVMGGSFLYVYGSGHITLSKNCRVATELAAQKLEDFRADNARNIDIPKDANDILDEEIILGDVTFTRKTEVEIPTDEYAGLFKNVRVTVQWGKDNKNEVVLATRYVKR